LVKIDNYGNAFCSPPALSTVACEVDVENFPFDEKHCTLKFARYDYCLIFLTKYKKMYGLLFMTIKMDFLNTYLIIYFMKYLILVGCTQVNS